MNKIEREYITRPQFVEMVVLQEELNEKYSGKSWRKTVPMGKIMSAFFTEYSEFLAEIETKWLWYKKEPNFDKSKAIYELIDVIHFGLTLCLCRHSVNEIEALLSSDPNLGPYIYGHADDEMCKINRSVNRFIWAVDNDNLEYMIIGMSNIIKSGADLLDLEEYSIFDYYKIKNNRNHQRVDGGILDGKYNKNNESELKDIYEYVERNIP